MKARILDEEALSAPSPRSIRVYLRARGWDRQLGNALRPDVWTLESGIGTYEVIAPSASARDFPKRVGELLRTLSIVEERSELDVLRDLQTLSFDVQYVRMEHPGPTGTAPLRDAARALDAAYSALAASTTALREPRLVLPHRHPTHTNELMRRVLAGPTGEGSYIVSLWVPVPPKLTPEEDRVLFELEDAPFERRATLSFYRALRETRDALDEVQLQAGIEAFTERMDLGISANLCEALVGISGEDEVPYDVRFSWALERPVRGEDETISFRSESITTLREAARELRELVPEENVTIDGNVIRLHREGRFGSGEITISGVIRDDPTEKMRRVSVELSEPDYEAAIRAHDRYHDVSISGSLQRRGTRTHLTQARSFTVSEE